MTPQGAPRKLMDALAPDALLWRLNEAFQHRSERVIALGRLLLAVVFLVAIYLDPAQPHVAPNLGYSILVGYVVFAAVLLGVVWNRWWLERRLALFGLAVDISVFTVMVCLTQGFTSPFFTFFVFLLLSSTIRWGWRETAMTAAVVIPLFQMSGLIAMQWGGGTFELRRFLIRIAYMLVLSFIFVWFAYAHQIARLQPRQAGGEDLVRNTPRARVRRIIEAAAEKARAGRAMLVWSEIEEPWLNVSTFQGGVFTTERHSPDRYRALTEPGLEDELFVFQRRRRHVLSLGPNGRSRLGKGTGLSPDLAEDLSVEDGLAVPVRSDDYEGLLILTDVEGLCSDTLKVGRRLSDEMAADMERLSTLRASEESAVARTRLSLARDLHDSVVQILAGANFRLESLKRAAAGGEDIGNDIDDLQQQLSHEQQMLRQMIVRLQSDAVDGETVDIKANIGPLAEVLSRRWDIACTLGRCSDRRVTEALAHELDQLVREAVANAVRHGRARNVAIDLDERDGGLRLTIGDDGGGFPVAGEFSDEDLRAGKLAPWSVGGRVRALGGRLGLSSGPSGARLIIDLPMETSA